MDTTGKAMMFAGAALALVGLLLWLMSKGGVSRLPGDLILRGDNVTVFLPLGTMLLLSIVATIVLNIILRR
jgi:hypothetical protein